MSKPTLTSGLIATKGQAAPAVRHDHLTAPVTPAAAPVAAEPEAKPATAYYKALTIKLDKEHYDALKSLGIKLDKKSQEIFVLALKDFLAKHNAI